jgi:type IV pilus assembly protein PilV
VETVSVTYSRTQAMAVARDIIERININPQAWPGGYDGSDSKWVNELVAPQTCIGVAAACNTAEMAAMDVYEVRSIVQSMLFNGKVEIEAKCNDQEVACVKVAWDETSLDGCNPDDVSAQGAGANGNCVIVEFWPQRALLAAGEGI